MCSGDRGGYTSNETGNPSLCELTMPSRRVECEIEEASAIAPILARDSLSSRMCPMGLSGHSDMRDLFERAHSGDANATEAIEVWAWRARHYLGAYMAQFGGLDAVTFAGGIGENQGALRSQILKGCEGLGIVLDDDANVASVSEPRRISSVDSAVEVWVIPTNEELHIARLALGVSRAATQ